MNSFEGSLPPFQSRIRENSNTIKILYLLNIITALQCDQMAILFVQRLAI